MMSFINGVHQLLRKGAAGWVSGGEGAEREKRWGLNGTGPGIMIGLWDLTTAANRCQESMNLIYSTLGVEGVDGSQCGAKGVVGSESGPAVDVVIVYSEMPSWALGG